MSEKIDGTNATLVNMIGKILLTLLATTAVYDLSCMTYLYVAGPGKCNYQAVTPSTFCHGSVCLSVTMSLAQATGICSAQEMK